MKAIVYTEYGGPEVLRVKEVPDPAPAENEVLIKVHTVNVNYGDLLARNFGNINKDNFHMPSLLMFPSRIAFGYNSPKKNILGNEFAGVVKAAGAKVTKFKPGDYVFGYSGQSMGAYAEYICMKESGMIAAKPSSLSFEEAAAIPYSGLMAVSLLSKVEIKPGQKVLVNGASGGIGSGVVQIAKSLGAEVTGTCGAPRMDYVKALGADYIIDYKSNDFTVNGEKYNLIFDVLGKLDYAKCKNSLTDNGVMIYASFKMDKLVKTLTNSMTGKHKIICSLAPENPDVLRKVSGLAEAGKFKSIIDRTFPLELAADAHAYAESGAKRGSVVLRVVN
ncbi:MAG: NAD(P)-dependent alcohol dehydrogenase [Ignavibacteriaceae bacterium]|nr:NAD(P)-dependent alcohol dehydrogenase [Ignavibacteriaceae bacterium]